MRESYRKPIASKEKFPQFITMNVIDGQAGLVRYSSLIFYSLTINNILNIIILVILAAVSVAAVYNMGIVNHAINGTQDYAQRAVEENQMLDSTTSLMENTIAKLGEILSESTSVPDITKNKWIITDDKERWRGSILQFNSNGDIVGDDRFAMSYELNDGQLVCIDSFGESFSYEYNGKCFVLSSDGHHAEKLIECIPISFTVDGTKYNAERWDDLG